MASLDQGRSALNPASLGLRPRWVSRLVSIPSLWCLPNSWLLSLASQPADKILLAAHDVDTLPSNVVVRGPRVQSAQQVAASVGRRHPAHSTGLFAMPVSTCFPRVQSSPSSPMRSPFCFFLTMLTYSSSSSQRKTKCSGDRPRCVNCTRVNRSCHYESYSSTMAAMAGNPLANTLASFPPGFGDV